jgi:LemA protein
MKNLGCIAIVGVLVLVGIVGALSSTGIYNGLVEAKQQVDAQWAQVESVYQRRADLVPNLVATVKGAAAFEQDTLTKVTEARSRVGSVQLTPQMLNDPQAFQRFQAAQDGLSSALSRLLVVSEQYPDLKAVAGFRDLMATLAETENQIAVERRRFNEVAQSYNTRLGRVPAAWFISLLHWQFPPRPYFTAQPGAATVPKVDFGAK